MKEITTNIKTILLLGTIVFFLGMFYFGDGLSENWRYNMQNYGIYILYALVLTLANGYYFRYITKNYPWKTDFKKQLIYGFAGSLVLSVFVLIVLRFVVSVLFYNHDPATFLEGSKSYFLFSISITVLITLLFYLIYFYKANAEQKVNESQIVAKTETAKYESLKSQLDPHFLFNSLNVLTSLIGENPELAEKFTTKLSKVYRYVLEQKSKDLIPLEEELQFAASYMELLEMRFEDAIHFELPKIISNPDYKIVPLSLQILLENAVKHNVISSENPLKIKISEANGYLTVSNNLNEKSVLTNSTKVGLNNIKERYNLITQKKVEIGVEKGYFIARIPLLTQKITQMKTDINEETKYYRAKKRVEEIKGFYASLIAYCVVIPFLIFIWYRFSSNTIQWFWFPMFGWGFGLLFQGMHAFGYNPIFGKDWEERKVREFMKEDEKQYWE